MNTAYLHLLLNHFPIIGMIIGFLVLLYGLVANQRVAARVALAILFGAALFGVGSMATGEAAEHASEAAGRSHDLIHEHEEAAELAIWFSHLAGIVALLGLILGRKQAQARHLWTYLALVTALAANVMLARVGQTGGIISHEHIIKVEQSGLIDDAGHGGGHEAGHDDD